jgi:Ca2+-binding RTX toxin-like protein
MDLQSTLREIRATLTGNERRKQSRRLLFEQLNNRSMLAVTATFYECTGVEWAQGAGIVQVNGDAAPNTITIAVMGGNIQVNVAGEGDALGGGGKAVGLVKGIYATLGGDADTLDLSGMTALNGFAAPATEGSCTVAGGVEVIANASGMGTLMGGDGNDTIIGSPYNDSIIGGDGRDSLLGGSGDGADVIYGDLGAHQSNTSGERDTIAGGSGNDSIYGQGAPDNISGEAGHDYIGGGDEGMQWSGEGDTISGGANNDSIFGGDGKDSIWGDAGNDFVQGEGGSDSIRGGANDDSILGGNGSIDYLYGETGNDHVGGDSSDYGWGGEETEDTDKVWGELGHEAEFEGEESAPSGVPQSAQHV